ncbi:SMP-30/gluconolactonase/LRE family protein [Nocardioides sp. T2.26MG-1]|uniref:SMP-30/gluconolactonase/LRE family protein n=1 Tax=Nocardioides sp. T2.26MG-1 TaxID=3041166 RepID=UPI0024773F93|nr:SMP-30/gluconolactonase/LRE family protein [Nocardioides sp. T2.26MG-1]CAI9398937.1 Virginiamycin B lyase [Nocardioides sp. T2.26MG-1]
METTTDPRVPHRARHAVLTAVASLALLAPATASAVPAGASPHAPVSTVAALDDAAGQHPEGLAVARDGSLYVGMAPTGQLARIGLDGTVTALGAPAFPAEAGYLLGLALDGEDRVYGAVVRFDGQPSGVWRYDATTEAWSLFAATDPGGFPNGLAFEADGTLLVSDMTLGTIWAVDEAGHVTQWLHHPALEGATNDAGVNGLAVDREGDVWFTNTDGGAVGRIRVDRHGDPVGRPRIVATDPRLASADGLALDVAGNVWVAASYGSDRLLRVTPRGRVVLVAEDADGLDYTASVAFGRTRDTRHTLFFTNSGDSFATPSVMSTRSAEPGLRLRYP